METKRVARRNHSAEFRAQVLAACREPGASVAAIAMRNGLNANVIYRWLRDKPHETQAPLVTATQASQVTSFLAVQLPQPVAKPVTVTASAEIRMELRRGGSSVTVNWPLQCSAECAAWLRDWLR
jgi:transposase-like protein